MEEQEIHIRDYLRVLYKRRNTVFAFFYIVVTIVVTKTFLATPIYQASTRALIEKAEPQNLSLVNSYYMPWDPEFYETQVQIIESVAIAEKVVDMLDLVENYDRYLGDIKPSFSLIGSVMKFVGGLLPEKKPPEMVGAAGEAGEPDPATGLARMISSGLAVTPLKDSKIVTVGYTSPNPELAALIVNSVMEAYMAELLEMKMSSSRYSIQWMTEKAQEEGAKLEASERELQAYMKASDIITLENRIAIIPQKLAELSVELTKAETNRKVMEEVFSKIESFGGDIDRAETLPIIQQTPSLQTLRAELRKAEQNVSELSKKYGEKHPVMKVAESELAELRSKREQETRRVIESIRNEFDLARANEESLRRRLATTKKEALDLNEKFIQFEVLKRAVETNRQFYNALMTKTKEQSITEQIQSINVWVLEKAELPNSPIRPRRARNVLLGIIVGLFGGVGMAFFAEYLDNTVKSPDDVEMKSGLPVLGVIPRLKEKSKKIEDVVLTDPRSQHGESYKSLRTSILLSAIERPPRSILVTSMISGEGKTSTAVNLAIALAQSNHRTLLVDGDLRKPNVHRVFGLKNDKGLSTRLAGISDSDIVMETPVENLSVVTPGPVPPNPSELLGSAKVKEMIAKFEEDFDIVIIDSAPILTVADSLLLTRSVEKVLLVARAGITTYEMLRRGIRSLSDINADILGVVVNAHDEKRSGYYYHYKDYNYVGDEDKKPTPAGPEAS